MRRVGGGGDRRLDDPAALIGERRTLRVRFPRWRWVLALASLVPLPSGFWIVEEVEVEIADACIVERDGEQVLDVSLKPV